jgi:prevent-host-death family protein
MEATARELNQQTARFLAAVEHGEEVVVTKNGRPVAVVRPYGVADQPVRPFRTDPMGDDADAPVLRGGPADLSVRADDYLADGFGR